jgi:hypothetical protein
MNFGVDTNIQTTAVGAFLLWVLFKPGSQSFHQFYKLSNAFQLNFLLNQSPCILLSTQSCFALCLCVFVLFLRQGLTVLSRLASNF